MITTDEVLWGYRFFLNRDPENAGAVRYAITNYSTRSDFVQALKNSQEYRRAVPEVAASPFWHFASAFDAVGLIKKNARQGLAPSTSHVTNFLGVKVRPEVFPNILPAMVGTVEPPPIPANWHADIAEWGSCLRAVELSGDRFSMMELGCGWGCWMNNLGVAAKNAGKKVKLYGIEADPDHLAFARTSLSDNQISTSEYSLLHGIAGTKGSIALFPKIESGINWGGTAIFSPTATQLAEAEESDQYVRLPIVDIPKVLKDEVRLDLLHVDIQGAELELLRELFPVLCKKVRYVFIGTHSKQIEGGLFDLFLQGAQWNLEMERPAIFQIVDGKPVVVCDGVQAWRNNGVA
jgi:FkbM family methyltransferase